MMVDEDSSYANEELIAEFTLIADVLIECPDEPCRSLVFQGNLGNFSVLEIEDSQRIEGCLLRDTETEISVKNEHNGFDPNA